MAQTFLLGCSVVVSLLLVAGAFTNSVRARETTVKTLHVQRAIPSISFGSASSRLERMLSPNCELAPNKLIMLAEVDLEYLRKGMFANWYQSAYPYLHSSIKFLFDVPDTRAIHELRKLKYLPDDVLILNDKMDIVPLVESSSIASSTIALFQPPWGSQEYHDLVVRQPKALKLLLEKNCTVLSFDIDTWWAKNPFDDIASTNNELLITDDSSWNLHTKSQNVCSCFLFMTPTLPVLKLVEDWLEKVASEESAGNQPPFNLALKDNWGNVDYAFLSYKHFPPGGVVTEGRHSPSEVVLYHANWVKGIDAKIAFLSKLDMWHPRRAGSLPQQQVQSS